jgi:hypothetical protein
MGLCLEIAMVIVLTHNVQQFAQRKGKQVQEKSQPVSAGSG